MAMRELSRVSQEISTIEQDLNAVTEQTNAVQNNFFKNSEKIDNIKAEMKMNEEQLQEWIKVQDEKEQDNMAIMKYSQEDESKIKSINLQIENMMTQVMKQSTLLDSTVSLEQHMKINLWFFRSQILRLLSSS